ncbi:MAG: hypothetical protein CVU42_01800 [Chloroflexi bacterium HGW-Chloroflexi-4]|jgi:PHD/YefM family antitoxin component YafN of YafNO toxin-antitoxin module|nr:MAG: hypothetical protein CVU42_01800 [Chloroflexi bacterium HGW-Chloroflexi-4]
MDNKWHLENTTNPINLIIDECLIRGPQVYLFRGKEIAVVISLKEYREKSINNKLPYYFLSPDNHRLIKRNGEKIAVVLPYSDFKELNKNRGTLSSFFRKSPLSLIDLRRDHTITPEDLLN